jgi:REP element-mobilizing transposase RayT
MPYDPQKHHRRSIRLKGYDYASPGSYFVTLCTQDRVPRFGRVVDGVMILNDAGRMVAREWAAIPERFPTIRSDAHVIMPNHFHAIITIEYTGERTDQRTGDPRDRPKTHDRPKTRDRPDASGAGTRPAPTGVGAGTDRPTLGNVVGAFKSITTHAYIVGVRSMGWPPFNKRVWQRNYWERIIRDPSEFNRIRRYIQNNPARWTEDQLHPGAPPNSYNRG